MPPPRTSLITSIISSTRLPRLAYGYAAPLEFLRRPADSDTEAEAVVGQVGHRPHLARQQQRVAGARASSRWCRTAASTSPHPSRPRRSAGPPTAVFCVPHPRAVGGVRVVGRLLLHVEHASPAARSSRTRAPLRSWRSRRSWSIRLIATLQVYCIFAHGLSAPTHPHRVVLRAAAVGVAERLAGTLDLVVAGLAHHLDGRLGEADHARCADRVRRQHAAGRR